MFVALLLAGCGRAATAAPRAPAAPASTPTPTAPGLACNASTASGTRIGDLLVSAGGSLNFSSRKLPAGIPLEPLQIPNPNDTAALDAQIPVSPEINPQRVEGVVGFTIGICNASTTGSHLIEGVTLQIVSFTPFAGGVNAWNVCDGFFTRSKPFSSTGGGCGGTEVSDEELHVTLPPQAGAGFTVAAVRTGPATSPFGFGPLPVTVAPGKALSMHISVTPPQAPGTYTFSFSVTADHAQLPFMGAGSPFLFAPIAHKFTGAACLSQVMQQQIPLQVTPALFFICPEGVFVVPTPVPGKG